MLTRLIFLHDLRFASDATLLFLRLFVGAFLVWGVWDNIISSERMTEFERFLDRHGFIWPGIMAPLSVWSQFACGIAFLLGLLTRWAGLICAGNFIVAVVMVDAAGGPRQAFPATMLVLVGLYLATFGAGRFGLDALLTSKLR